MADVMQKPGQQKSPPPSTLMHRAAPPVANQTNARGMVPGKARRRYAEGTDDVQPSLLDRTANASTAAYAQAGDALRAGNLPAAAGAAVHGLVATPASWLARGAQLAPDIVGGVAHSFADLGRGLIGAPVAAAPAAVAAPVVAPAPRQAAIPVTRDDAVTALSQAVFAPQRTAVRPDTIAAPAAAAARPVKAVAVAKQVTPAPSVRPNAQQPISPAQALQAPHTMSSDDFSRATAGMSLDQMESYARARDTFARAQAQQWNMHHYDPQAWALSKLIQEAHDSNNKAEEKRLLGHQAKILSPAYDPAATAMPEPR